MGLVCYLQELEHSRFGNNASGRSFDDCRKMGISGFAASNGWLESFKKQHNLHHMAIAGEDGDVKDETIESWNERVREITRGWKPEDVWKMDETGSFWRGLPETSLNEKGRRCNGGKQAKQYMGVLR